jgi:hypothetical protein
VTALLSGTARHWIHFKSPALRMSTGCMPRADAGDPSLKRRSTLPPPSPSRLINMGSASTEWESRPVACHSLKEEYRVRLHTCGKVAHSLSLGAQRLWYTLASTVPQLKATWPMLCRVVMVGQNSPSNSGAWRMSTTFRRNETLSQPPEEEMPRPTNTLLTSSMFTFRKCPV